MDVSPEERFAGALRRLTDLHGVAVVLAGCSDEAERAFADGLRVGDQVRRAVRQGRPDRPGVADAEAIEAVSAGLREVVTRRLASGEVARLREALASRDPSAIARASQEVYADLAIPDPTPRVACRGLRLRRRRGGFETLVAPATLAGEIEAARRLGAAPNQPNEPAGPGDEVASLLGGLPEPVVLDPAPEATGSEVCLAWEVRDLASDPLLCLRSGDLWLFAPNPEARAAVAIANEPEDEWWQASEVGWEAWSADLRRRLAERGIEVFDYSSSLPQKNGSRSSRMRGVMK